MIPPGFTLPIKPFLGVILIVGTFCTLFLRSFNIFNVGGKNILLAGITLSLLISVLSLQAFKDFLEGKLRFGFWHLATLLFFAVLMGYSTLIHGFGKMMTDSRYFMWVMWGYLVFESIKSRPDNAAFQFKAMRVAGILTIGYSFFTMMAGIGGKQLTTGGFRYVEEDSLAYIAVVFFFIISRMMIKKSYAPSGFIVLLAAVFFIISSAKRAVWGGIGLGLMAQAIVSGINPRKIAGLCLIGLLAGGVLFKLSDERRDILQNRLAVVTKGKITDPSIFFRFAAWKKVIDAGVRNPFVPGGLGSDFDFELNVLGLKQKFLDVSPHNTVMWVFYKTGVIGLFFYFRLLFVTWLRAQKTLRHYRETGDMENQILSSVLLSLFIYATFASMFWDYFAIASMAIIYWWIIAAINGMHFAEKQPAIKAHGAKRAV